MISVCMKCDVVYAWVKGEKISHGYCFLHGLQMLRDSNLATPEELEQLAEAEAYMRGKTHERDSEADHGRGNPGSRSSDQ